MLVSIDIGPALQKAISETAGFAESIGPAVSRGLLIAVKDIAAPKVTRDYLSGQSLRSRTGSLRRSVDGWMEGDYSAAVGVQSPSMVDRYAWLLTDEEKTITPQKGRFLAIPIGENLTGAGVARFSSPRQVPGGFFVNTGGRLLFGVRQGKTSRAKFRPYFLLVTSVFVQGSGALADGVLDSVDDMAQAIQDQVDMEVTS